MLLYIFFKKQKMKKTEKKRNEKNQNAKYLKMQKQHKRFMQWMISDNVIRIKDNQSAYWTSQDAQYSNKLHTMLDAWNYYQREFINQ